ncbi:MAG: PQQ-dependent sugar dehydrogenase, partial [Bacteroidota bacterium]
MIRRFIAKLWLALSLCGPLYLGAQFPQGFTHETIIEGRQQINGVTFDANGRLYFWEKHGAVFIVEDGQMLSAPLLDIRDEAANWRDHGLLGFALDPGFLNNGYLYALYVVDRYALFHRDDPDYDPHVSEEFAATIGRVTRFTADPATNFTTLIPDSRKVLLGETPQTGIPILHESHGVGSLVFGTDGTLLVSTGDAASYLGIDTGGEEGGAYISQALADGIIRPKEDVGAFRAQLIDCHNGKLLRIDPQTGNGLPSNPFYDATAPRAPRSRVWTMGLRNPFRFAILPETGSHDPADGNPGVFMVGDVGFTRWEELTRIGQGGLNGGWPYYEGLRHHPYFWGKRTFNLDAPNPWYDGASCDEPFLAFQDLMQQPNAQGNYLYTHPCRPGEPLPDSLPTFVHHPPEMDWGNQYLEPEIVRTTRFDAQGQLELVRIS